MPKYIVIANFFDAQNKKRRIIGDTVEVDEKRAKKLKAAGVIELEVVEKKEAPKKEKKSK